MTAKSNVLLTPMDIYNASVGCFPNLQVKIAIGDDHTTTMSLTLSGKVRTLVISKAIVSEEFQNTIEKLSRRIKLDMLGETSKETYPFNIRTFSLEHPLSGGYRLRRFIHEKTGNAFNSVIMDFLQNPQEQTVITNLGLAPNQVEDNCEKHGLDYFIRFCGHLETLNRDLGRAKLSQFMNSYPNVAKLSLEALVKQKRQKKMQFRGDDQYSIILQGLHKEIIAQELAVGKLASFLVSQANNTADNRVFMFVGPTGVGKTALAKVIAKVKKCQFLMISMNRFPNEDGYSYFWGAGSGLIGSTDKPHFAKQLDTLKPSVSGQVHTVSNAVLLFDHFEKAHIKIRQSFLTLFDENYCIFEYSSSDGRRNISTRYNFKKTVFICTSNLLQDQILSDFNNHLGVSRILQRFKDSCRLLPEKKSCSQKLLGRITVIPFGPIPRGRDFQKLIKLDMLLFIKELKKEFSCKVEVENELLLLRSLETKWYNTGINIRRLKRYFDNTKVEIYMQRKNFGDSSSMKFLFCVEENIPIIKFLYFLEFTEEYEECDLPSISFSE